MTAGADLIRRMAAGDRDAFAPFYDRFAPLVFPLVLRIVRERAEAGDVLQEIFWDAWQAADAYDPARGGPEAWMVMRARRRAIDRVRSLPGHTMSEDVCEATLRESEETLVRLAVEGPRVSPPAEARRALIERLQATAPRREPIAPRSTWLMWAAGTAAAAIAVAAFTAGFVATRYEARLGVMAREASRTRERLRQEQAALRAELAVYAGVVDLLRDPATRVVALRGLAPVPGAGARLVWNEARGGHLLVADLPPAPPGRTYALWTIAAGAPRPAGLFQTDATGKGSHRVAPVAGGTPAEVFAVTLEPAGGVPSPTGPRVLASK